MSIEQFPRRQRRPVRGQGLQAAAVGLALSLLGCTREPVAQPGPTADASATASRAPDVPYEPSPRSVVGTMLDLGHVDASDVVYDLGCGDGRIVIAAVKERGARGVCVDIDPVRIRESRENAERAGVAERIRFLTQDLFETNLADASVVMLFLWPEVNLRLKPKLLAELRPGTRIVSHWHDMGDWKPDERVDIVAEERERPVFVWLVPAMKSAPVE